MSDHTRPVLLGYIRADVLSSRTALPAMEAELDAFAHREEFSLGTIYVENGATPGAFHALLAEIDRNEAAWGVVVPDLRHLTDEEHLVMRSNQDAFATTAILIANFAPRAGGPGAASPVQRQVCHSSPQNV